jgi:hypothetical protein
MQNPSVGSWGSYYFEEKEHPILSFSLASMGPQASRHSHGEYLQPEISQQSYSYHPVLQQKYNNRPFKCDQCSRSFSRNHDLKRHKRIHLVVKPFPCGHCEKSFSRKDALKVCRMHDDNKLQTLQLTLSLETYICQRMRQGKPAKLDGDEFNVSEL